MSKTNLTVCKRKKFFPYIGIFLALIVFFSPVFVYAEFDPTAYGNYDDCKLGAELLAATEKSDVNVYLTQCRAQFPADAENDPVVPGETCGLSPSTWTTCFKDLFVWIAYTILGIMSLILWIAGAGLDLVLKYTIVEMSKNISGMSGINIAWKVIRDLMNMAFIFILVFEGIKMIIGFSDSNKVKKFIGFLILASLLINFSLFFTKVMIDASNIVTIGLYNSIINPSNNETDVAGQSSSISGLSVPFMEALGVSSFYSSATIEQMSKNAGGQTNLIIMGLAGSILFLIISFVFLAVAVMFVIRYIALIILMMLSPIAYMGMALPFIKEYSKQWWAAFKSQLLFAPIYMLITWVILTLMSSPGFISNSGAQWQDMLIPDENGNANPESLSLLLNFAVIIGLTIASLVIAASTAKKGSQLISKAVGMGTAFAGGAIMGGSARLARNTVGRAGQAIADNRWLKERAPDSRLARTAISVGKTTGSASFDTRATGIGKAAFSGIDIGKAGGKGGYEAKREEKIKARMDFAEKSFNDTVTGTNIENEMTNRRWTSQADNTWLQNTVGLTGAQIAAINANGASKNQMEALGINARQAEHMRRRVHGDLNLALIQENANRRDRYLHNLSQTHWYTPNLYSGVSEDAEAAERLRGNKKAKKSGKDKVLADLADILKEEDKGGESGESATPTTPTAPESTPPTPPTS